MTYLIAQIWVFIAAASAVGLVFGWMFRGGVSANRLRDLRRELAQAQAEAADQRREAAELAARAERRFSGGTAVDAVRLETELRGARDSIVNLEARLREAEGAVERHAAEADELRARIAEDGPAPAARDEEAEREVENLRVRLREAEYQVENLQGQLESAAERAVEPSGDEIALRARVAELEAALGEARDDAAAAALAADREGDEEAAALRARLETLEGALAEARAAKDGGEAEAASLRDRLAGLESALAEARAAVPSDAGDPEEVSALRARVAALESELAARAAAPSEVEALRSRVEELQGELADARAVDDAVVEPVPAAELSEGDDIEAEAARLRWRNSYLTSRIHFLEARGKDGARAEGGDGASANAHEPGEVEKLRARIVELEAARTAAEAAMADRSGEPAPNVDGGGGSLEWRNRYLASRVRYLERQLEEKGADGGSASEEELREKLAEAEDQANAAVKLRTRVAELERALERAQAEDDGAAKSEGEYALEWRNRYLSSRVKYLEDRLAKAGAPVGADEAG